MEKIGQASLLLYVFDVSQMSAAEVSDDLKKLENKNIQLVVVANKMDLNPYAKAEEFISPYLRHDQFIPVSAKNDMNVEYLKDYLYDLIAGSRLNEESVIVANARHIGALQNTDQALEKVLTGFNQQVTSDFIAMDMRQAIYHLGEITGEISTDDLLEHIFKNFCIGK